MSEQLKLLNVNDEQLLAAMRYSSTNGGKRIRPFLVYEVGQMLGASLNDLDAPAAAIELIHCYSLIHDDLPSMDDDDLRRGRPTCHKAFDEATAILAGDSIQSLSFDIISSKHYQAVPSKKVVQMIQVLAQSAGYAGMCGGQAMDLNATDCDISLAKLEQIHQLKTGALISAAVHLGYLCSPIDNPEIVNALKIYSNNIGLAFQVQDDILDIIGSTAELGKPQGSDINAAKSTYPALLGLEGAKQKAHLLIDEALHALSTLPYNTAILRDFAHYIIERKF